MLLLTFRIFLLVILGLILVQDFRTRSVQWVLFPVLIALCLIVNVLDSDSLFLLWQPVLFNICFLTLQLILLSLYFSIKYGKWINITRDLLGWGDILFLASIGFYLSVINFVFFYLISLPLVLLFWLGERILFVNNINRQIPLAGFQSLLLIVFLAGDWWFFHMNINNDRWLLQYLNLWH